MTETKTPYSVPNKSLHERIAGRKAAEELIELADLDNQTLEYQIAFKAAMVNRFAPKTGDVPPNAMDEKEAAAFEKKLLGFGSHGDKTWGEASIDYLLWLHEQNQKLARYLRSSAGQKRQADDGE